jgi:uncharacterized membrane protein YphA (DoxX/SURF4 family)
VLDLPSIHQEIRTGEPQPRTTEGKPWSPGTRIAFRFAFVYLVLYNLPFPLGTIYTDALAQWYAKPWDALVCWVGRSVLHLGVEISTTETGSGDRTYDYVLMLCFVVLSVAGAGLWSLLDRRRGAYPRLMQWLRLYVRFSLGAAMISYGSAKVIQAQFPAPPLSRLLQPFGDASPMGLLWTFMGASQAYNVFTGGAEMLGGILLFARRTTTLGALVCTGVLSNVVMLNLCYDVPVKQYSMHLLLMAIFLLLPDLRRVADALVFNRPAQARELRPLFAGKRPNQVALALRTLFLAALVGTSLQQSYGQYRTYADVAEQLPHYGIWEVEEFTIGGQARPALVTDPDRWRRVVFGSPYWLAVQMTDGGRQQFRMKLDADKKTLELTRRGDPNAKAVFTIEQTQPTKLSLTGDLETKRIQAKLRLIEQPPFRLTTRGFHWINEIPYNQ